MKNEGTNFQSSASHVTQRTLSHQGAGHTFVVFADLKAPAAKCLDPQVNSHKHADSNGLIRLGNGLKFLLRARLFVHILTRNPIESNQNGLHWSYWHFGLFLHFSGAHGVPLASKLAKSCLEVPGDRISNELNIWVVEPMKNITWQEHATSTSTFIGVY